jgi:hypothetical protein
MKKPLPIPTPARTTITYLLRQIDPLIWRQLKSKAALEGITMHELVTRILTDAAK